MSVTFTEPWGARSWKVQYEGKYANDRQSHVEVGKDNMGKYQANQTFQLTNKHLMGRAIVYDVVGCENGKNTAHFTVYFAKSVEEAQERLAEF